MILNVKPDSSSISFSISANRISSNLYRSIEQLSSGLRINRASDDPAGLVISEQLRSQIASLNQEIDNISASIGKYETVSSSAMELRSKLTDLRSLALGASNEAFNSEAAQEAYNTSAQNIVASYNETIEEAEYNGTATLDGSADAMADISALSDIDLSTVEAAEASVARIDEAIAEIDSVLVDLGSEQRYDLESRQTSLEVSRQNLISAESQIRDADMGEVYSQFIKSLIQQKALTAMMAHREVVSENVLTLLNI